MPDAVLDPVLDASADAGPATTCHADEVEGDDGGCSRVGVRACADRWRDAEGRCRPALAACPGDSIPNLATGECDPVGLPKCADVFREADGRCRPSLAKCPAGRMPIPSLGCVSVDDAPDVGGCGEPPFGNIRDEYTMHFVDPQAPPGGDGTRAHPHRTIAEALASMAPGSEENTIALAAGRYEEPLLITGHLHTHVRGRCASMVTLAGDTPVPDEANRFLAGPDHGAAVVVYEQQGADLSGVTLEHPRVALRVHHSVSVGLTGVHLTGAVNSMVFSTGGSTVGLGWSWIEGPPTRDGELYDTQGGVSATGGQIKLRQAAITGVRASGVALTEGALGDLEDSLVEGTGWHDHPDVPAIYLGYGSFASVRGVAVVGNRLGISASDGSFLEAERSLVADSVGDGRDRPPGHAEGVSVRLGSEARLTANVVTGNGGAALKAESEHTYVESRSNLYADTYGTGTPHGVGLDLRTKSRTVSVGDVITGNTGAGIYVYSNEGPAAALDMQGALVMGNHPDPDGRGGRGIVVLTDSVANLRDSVVLDNLEVGIQVSTPGANLAAAFCDVAGTRPNERDGGQLGVGVAVQLGAVGAFDRCRVEDNSVAGVLVSGVGLPSRVDFRDGLVRDTRPGRFLELDGTPHDDLRFGMVATEATLRISGSEVRSGGDVGLLYDASDGAVEATRVLETQVGLVVQGQPRPTYDPDDGRLGPIETDGALPTPAVETPLPP